MTHGKQENQETYPGGQQEWSLEAPQVEIGDLPENLAVPREECGIPGATPADHLNLASTLADLWDLGVPKGACRIPEVSPNVLQEWGAD